MADPIPAPLGPVFSMPAATAPESRRSEAPITPAPAAYAADGSSVSTVSPASTPVPKQPLRLTAIDPTSLFPSPGVLPTWMYLSAGKPAITPVPGAPNATSAAMADLGDARQRQRWLEANAYKSEASLSQLQGPAVIGSVLAGAALATGVGIDLSKGTLFGPPSTQPGVTISGSPSLEGGSISISGRF